MHSDHQLSESQLLSKYGFGDDSSYDEQVLLFVLLFCKRYGYSIEFYEDLDKQKAFLAELSSSLPSNLRSLLKDALANDSFNTSVHLRYYLCWDLRQKSSEELFSDYPMVLAALLKRIKIHWLPCEFLESNLGLIKLVCAVKQYINHLDWGTDDGNFVYDPKNTNVDDPLCRFLLFELLTYDPTPQEDTLTLQSDAQGDMSSCDMSTGPGRAEIPQGGDMRSVSGCVLNEEKVYSDTVQQQVADDWELNDYYDEEWRIETYVDYVPYSQVDEDLLHGLDTYYEREGFYAIIHYDPQICNSPETHAVIKSLIDAGWLKQVITDGRSVIAVVGVYGGYDRVEFKYFDGKRILDYEGIANPVPYSIITDEKHDCYLYPNLYIDRDAGEGYTFIALGDLCEVDSDSMYELILSSVTYSTLPRYYFSSDMLEIIENAQAPRSYHVSLKTAIYKDPHVHLNARGELFLNNTSGFYMCPEEKGWALRVKNNLISQEYLTYVLFHDAGLTELLAMVIPSADLLLKHKVAIVKDRKRQEQIMSEFAEKTALVVNTNAVYQIALVERSGQCHGFLSWGLEARPYERVQGEYGLLDAIEREIYVPDAIIIDAVVDSVRDRYKGLRELLSKVRPKDIPVYLYTDVSVDLLQEDLHEEEFRYIIDGRYFQRAEEGAIERLVRNLRNELDGNSNHIAHLKGQYIREFKAAKWLDEKFPKLNVDSDLLYCLLQPNKSMNLMRGIFNALYKEIVKVISNGSGLERLDDGAFPSLMRDGSYHDIRRNVQYVIKGKVMPLPLAYSIRYASDMVAGASHLEDVEVMDFNGYVNQMNSENISKAVLDILMEFIMWLYEVRFEFGGHCFSEDPKSVLENLQWRGILKERKSKELYCETEEGTIVHVTSSDQRKISAKLGSEITIKRVKKETQKRSRYEWYAVNADWE